MFRTEPGEERALIEDWISRPALRKLVETYGGTWPTGSLEDVVAELVDFSEIWDYRGGERNRHMFHDDQDEPDPNAELTYWSAEELGMINPPAPSQRTYDYLLILGGLATGVEPRVGYAARLVDEGLEIRKQIAALGSFRQLTDRELPIAARYTPSGRYEIDHLSAMLGDMFDSSEKWSYVSTGDPEESPALASLVSTLERSDGPDLATYAAASSEPFKRPANTADTYDFLGDVAQMNAGERVLIVTSAIYLPYQHFDAVRTLRKLSLAIETIGVRREQRGPTHPPRAYRQEMRSALRSAELSLAVP